MQIGTAGRPVRGETANGDVAMVVLGPPTTIVLADGLGHGHAAAEAADAFCEFVRARLDGSPAEIVRAASSAFSHPRGAAAAVLRIDPARLSFSFCGVGNIELRARAAATVHPVCLPGVLGRSVRKVLQFDYVLSPGDILIAHTDGISTRFDPEAFATLDASAMAQEILATHAKAHDDATCVVVKL